ncbi:nucleoside hydrolase [Aquabacterium sp.]|uniref:nucleoside hydrolase n=1 Tax=Aquabacterium sp. TaxID=1872578 RepID=UPI002D0F0F57|nr:nucleoside hydrolase [Aquabacterium sp.]HSW04808.1 nucleoside hydrolase [Aquabacterium sp.]
MAGASQDRRPGPLAQGPRPVWLDTDPGFDDWLTMLMLAAHPGLRWLGISVVAGNAPLDITLANALAIRQLHRLQVPVYRGCDRPIAGTLDTAQHILGAQGLRSTGLPLPPAQALPDGDDAVAALLAALRHSPMPVTLIAIGPLTNIARALQAEPDAAARIDELVLMGGSTERGNHTPAAEFNMHADPEAADIVFRAGLRRRMFGLNLCRQVLLRQADVDQVRQWPGQPAQCLADHLDAYQRIRSANGSVPMPLYDPVVAAWLWQPALFGFQSARVDIELQGRFTRGMTVCDLRPAALPAANAELAMTADGPAVVALVLQVLQRALQA